MECDICHREYDAKQRPFLCAVDARNQIYEGRLKNAQLLIQNEELRSRIDGLMSEVDKGSQFALEKSKVQQRMTEDKTSQILAAADKLKEDIRTAREDVSIRRAALASRRFDFDAISKGLSERRARQQDEIEENIATYRTAWDQIAQDTAGTRYFLCSTAAELYGLSRVPKAGDGGDDFFMGKVPVVNLIALNGMSPEVISTSLAHLSHILTLAAHYLAIRLPAEITLPRRDYPRPTIYNLNGSYKHVNALGPATSKTGFSTSESRDSQHLSRPRPLFIDKPLPQLFRDDPTAYSFFLEGVTLLAYNIAWLCNTQNVPIIASDDPFEPICDMGSNLYRLLVSSQELVLNRNAEGNDPAMASSIVDKRAIGWYSHGSAYHFLGGPDGQELAKSVKLPSPMKLADMLRKKLLGDTPAPDWEVLDDEAWKVESVLGDQPSTENAFEQGKRGDLVPSSGRIADRSTSKGWMRVKSR